MNQILISAMWEVVMTSDLTHTLTRPLSQSVIMMTANDLLRIQNKYHHVEF